MPLIANAKALIIHSNKNIFGTLMLMLIMLCGDTNHVVYSFIDCMRDISPQ